MVSRRASKRDKRQKEKEKEFWNLGHYHNGVGITEFSRVQNHQRGGESEDGLNASGENSHVEFPGSRQLCSATSIVLVGLIHSIQV